MRGAYLDGKWLSQRTPAALQVQPNPLPRKVRESPSDAVARPPQDIKRYSAIILKKNDEKMVCNPTTINVNAKIADIVKPGVANPLRAHW